ncbi:Ribosomal RNA small subunit methyltransferase A [candidate division SR1 bacterium Aalborg_AAW-1]|nr:Ribosomal RNA small subunit methyltransferase A [candidate division SR1 bacterium Aalborg_AAW-1]
MSSYLGQNFLTDQTILDHIADQVQQLFVSTKSQTLVEIGPGKGALTERIQDLSTQTLLIEYDTKMVNYLNGHKIPSSHTKIVNKDILQRDEGNQEDFPFQTPQDKTLIVGNLPYYITSPILRKFFETQRPTRAGGVFLIQRESAEKIVHDAPKKSFLRWLINYAYKVEHCFDVPASAFTPPPKVVSTVIRVRPKAFSDIPHLDYRLLLQFLDLYSPYKRKTLGASHKIVDKHRQKNNNPDAIMFDITDYSSQRLEELGWEKMKNIIG